MEPRIQYAKTSDGVSIAFWTLGEGMGFVHMPWIHFSHIQLEWQSDDWRSVCESLARKRMLVRYDGRGTGLSDREVTDHSLEAHLLDLEAVVDKLGMKQFAVFASTFAGPPAIAYAARHPERVSHLLLWHAYARTSDWERSPRLQATRALIYKDWESYTETVAYAAMGWSAGEQARRFAALIRESTSQEFLVRRLNMFSSIELDVTPYLPQVTQPTLVLHRRHAPWPDVDAARSLAAGIPNARLAFLEGESAPFLGDSEAVLAAIDEFLSEEQESDAPQGHPATPAGLQTILFTDIEGSTAITQRLGDAKGREVLREHERITRECLKALGGSEVKTMGDGFMASFGSAARALECAVAIQRAFEARNEGVGAALAPPPPPANT